MTEPKPVPSPVSELNMPPTSPVLKRHNAEIIGFAVTAPPPPKPPAP